MTKPKITVHTLVKNEQRWVWFAIMSVLDAVDEIMVWDTGSVDKTPEVVNSINSPKIKYKQISVATPEDHTDARQKMLAATDADWIMILDGDEIWYRSSLKACLAAFADEKPSAIISPVINLVGDLYHYQDPKVSHYNIGSYHGAYNLRFVNRKIPGLHVGNPHGRQEYRNKDEVAIQNFPENELVFVDKPYLHTTHLLRSVALSDDKQTLKRNFKYRYELGMDFPPDFMYPEALYLPYPDLVPDPFYLRSLEYIIKSSLFTPVRIIKNTLFPVVPHGY